MSALWRRNRDMKVYLASPTHLFKQLEMKYEGLNILESFYYIKNDLSFLNASNILIDSGAFTFMNNLHKKVKISDFDDYVVKYANFLKNNKIKKYFELDIDAVTSIEHVEEIRKYLEKETKTPSIPVWHVERGIDYYKKMCKDYNYIAIGGMVSNKLKVLDNKKLNSLVNYAHRQGVKVHGLGFTGFRNLKKVHFDSVDSSSWTTGARYANFYKFDPKTGNIKATKKKPNQKMIDSKLLNKHNLEEWIKFQKWAEVNL